ncbi:hypothetical protein MNF30_01120 [Mycoplasma mycoides subsp. capri]|uniref:hypothetical protein n=1 Tax=Mycoplasma mycoides TaxID=2102 RepID=UPI0022404201|nr:hypothetical protein [Mycoplasma mycoides]UZK64412.1 hypothetical protein MNF30_01120 [Mycoplasma mycoides subsp. capri]
MISAFSILFLIIATLIILSWIFKWTNTTVKIGKNQQALDQITLAQAQEYID